MRTRRNSRPSAATSRVIEADETNYRSLVLDAAAPVLVEYWAPWCGPCRQVTPSLEQLARSYAGRARVVRVNGDRNPSLVRNHDIRGLPTVVLVHQGEEVQRLLGVRPKEQYRSLLDAALASPLAGAGELELDEVDPPEASVAAVSAAGRTGSGPS